MGIPIIRLLLIRVCRREDPIPNQDVESIAGSIASVDVSRTGIQYARSVEGDVDREGLFLVYYQVSAHVHRRGYVVHGHLFAPDGFKQMPPQGNIPSSKVRYEEAKHYTRHRERCW